MEIVIKLSAFILCIPVVFMLVYFRWLWIKWVRITIIIIHAVLLTYMSLFVFNSAGWNWGEQKALTETMTRNQPADTADYDAIHDEFILVDNTHDKQLIAYRTDSDSTNEVVTNRQMLRDLVAMLDNNKDVVDLVVYDIELNRNEPDNDFRRHLESLCSSKKLLLSINENNADEMHHQLNDSCYGNISEQGNDGLYVSHTLFRQRYFSMAYQMYNHIHNVQGSRPFFCSNLLSETDTSGKKKYVNNTFFPQFRLRDESLLRNRPLKTYIAPVQGQTDSGYEITDQYYYNLSGTLIDSGEPFIENLIIRKELGKKNIVFLGTFGKTAEDNHATVFGNLHGPAILLNIYYSLQLHQHYLSWQMILILFAGYLLITWALIRTTLGRATKWPVLFRHSRIPVRVRPSDSLRHNFLVKKISQVVQKWEKQKMVGLLFSVTRFFLVFLFHEELHQVLLLALIFTLYTTTGQMLNIFSLLIYLGVIKALLSFTKGRFLPEKQLH